MKLRGWLRLGGFVALMAPVLFSACSAQSGSGLRRHDLFTIPLGTLPGELDWFYRDAFRMAGAADIQSRDGMIFLSGGESGKVMVFNSYGDLLTLVHDPQKSPAPAVVEEGRETLSVTRWLFRTPRLIAAVEGGFLVDDGVDIRQGVMDAEFGAFYDRVVLRFDREGRYLGHLGREGFGGSPFPSITSIDVREDGGIVVTCHVPGAWLSYWYSRDGHPVTTVQIREDELPGIAENGIVEVYAVRPDPVNWTLHIRADIYNEEDGSRPEPFLYTLDLHTLLYGDPLTLTYSKGDPQEGIPSIPPEYLGTTVSGDHMMLALIDTGSYHMTLVDPQGRIVENRRIKVDGEATVYRRFRLQNNGLLSGIFFGSHEASVAWWRVDKIIDDESSP